MGSTPKRAVSLRSCRSYVPAEGARPATQRRPSSRGGNDRRVSICCANTESELRPDTRKNRLTPYTPFLVMSLCVHGNGPRGAAVPFLDPGGFRRGLLVAARD
jgi:hypothetical protein